MVNVLTFHIQKAHLQQVESQLDFSAFSIARLPKHNGTMPIVEHSAAKEPDTVLFSGMGGEQN